MKKINYLGLLSLLSLIAVLGWKTEETGLYGFLGFLYYARYFWVIPDELFLSNVKKTATLAFFTEMMTLILFMFVCTNFYNASQAIPMSFGLSFAVSIIVFSITLVVYEWKERKGAE